MIDPKLSLEDFLEIREKSYNELIVEVRLPTTEDLEVLLGED